MLLRVGGRPQPFAGGARTRSAIGPKTPRRPPPRRHAIPLPHSHPPQAKTHATMTAAERVSPTIPRSAGSHRPADPTRQPFHAQRADSLRMVFQLRPVPDVPSFFSIRVFVNFERPIPAG